jgi:uncharacterized protein
MKYFMAFNLACLLFVTGYAQNESKQPLARIIEVTGSAQLEIEPDEVYLSVNLKEYLKDKTKIGLDEIDKEFKKTLANAKIDLKDVSVSGAYGNGYYSYDWWRSRNQKVDFFASKTYTIKLPNLNKYNELMQQLDQKGIEHAYLQRTDHSKIEELRQQVKINALKAAKTKAKLMVEAVGNQLGEVVFIREINEGNYGRPVMYKTMSNMAMEDSNGGGADETISMQKLIIRFEVEAHFLIK